MTDDRPARRQDARRSAWIALIVAGGLLQGCAEERAVTGPHARVYAADVAGGARACTAPDPATTDGKTLEANMTVGNDGGWCGVKVHQPGPKPYDAGLLTGRAAHGEVVIHEVGDDTRLDYTPDRGYAGPDSFTVKLVPGGSIVRVNVTVTPPGGAPKA
jgi:hypothetical protein